MSEVGGGEAAYEWGRREGKKEKEQEFRDLLDEVSVGPGIEDCVACGRKINCTCNKAFGWLRRRLQGDAGGD